MRNLLIFLLVFFSISCETNKTQLELPCSEKTIFLGHKGSGTKGEFGNRFSDNSIEAILNALNQLDGTEFDLQMSADTTLWLFHDHEIINCQGEKVNFNTLSDSVIEMVSDCKYDGALAQLSQLVTEIKNKQFTDKTLSLDLKLLQNPVTLKKFGGEKLTNYTIEILNKSLLSLKEFSVLAEVPEQYQYELFNEKSAFETYLIQKNFDYLSNNTSAINYSAPIHYLNSDSITKKLNKRKGKLQLWVVNSAEEFFNASLVEPNYIQSDNLPMLNFFRKLKAGFAEELEKVISSILSNDEFITILDVEAENNPDKLYKFSVKNDVPDSLEVLLVISGKDKAGENTFWEKVDYNKKKHYYFYDATLNQSRQTSKIKFYLWNSEGHQINIKDFKVSSFSVDKTPGG